MKGHSTKTIGPLLLVLLSATPSALACATCFGRSDSALAQGMNMGILFLLGVILAVLGGIAGFIVFLARRAAALERTAESSVKV